MNNNKNFYDILQSKFNEREAPFEEENWKTMRKMIDRSRAAKKRAAWLIASLGLVLCMGGAYAFHAWKAEQESSKNILNVSSITNTTTKSSSGAQLTSSTGTAVKSDSKLADNNNSSKNVVTNQPAITNQVPVNKNQALAMNTALQNKKSAKRSPHGTKSGSQKIAVANQGTFLNKQTNLGEQESGSGSTLVSKEQVTSPGSTSAASNPKTANSSTRNHPVIPAKMPTKVLDTATAGDGQPQRFSDEPRIFMGMKNIFTIEAGTEWNTGWQYGATTQGHGFNPILGVGYTHYLSHQFFIKTGLQFSTLENMGSFGYNYQTGVTPISSGHIFNDSVIKTTRLYYVSIPIQVEYFIQHKLSICLGGSVSYLLGSSGYATTYQQYDNNPPVNLHKYSQNIQLGGYTKVNAEFDIGAKWIINRHFSIYGMINDGLTDIKDNSFFGENLFEKIGGFKLLGSYSF